MDSENKPQSKDLSAILEGLIIADVKFILVGGLAAVIQGAPVMTMDVDIVHELSEENVSKLFLFLKAVDAFYRRPDDKKIFPEKKHISKMGHNLFSTSMGPLDVLAFIEHEKTYADLIDFCIDVDFKGYTIKVLNIKKILELKKDSEYSKDRKWLSVLEETIKQLENE